MKKLIKLSILVWIALQFVGCSDSDSGEKAREEIPLSRAEVEVAQSVNGLTCALMNHMNDQAENNFVISPLGLSYTLGMMANGAVGETQQQMLEAINIGCDDIESLNNLMQKLMEKFPVVDPKTKVSLANAFWIDKVVSSSIKPAFVETLGTYYYADVTSQKNLGGTDGMDAINSWGKQHTGGLIPKVLGKPLGSGTHIACTNAIYFKGFWKQQFKKENTKNHRFTHLDNTFTYVYTMDHEGMRVQAYDEDDYRVAAIPYGNEAYSLIILLPNEGLDPMETFAKANIEDLTKLAKGEMYSCVYHVQLPRFTVDTGTDFVPTLKKMGMTLPFTSEADFSGIAGNGTTMSKALQSAKIIVDEEGTVAAAVSAAAGGLLSPGPPDNLEFFVNHPFAFAIAERSTGIFLFAGVVRRIDQ